MYIYIYTVSLFIFIHVKKQPNVTKLSIEQNFVNISLISWV